MNAYRCASCGAVIGYGYQPVRPPVLYCSEDCADVPTPQFSRREWERDEVILALVAGGASVAQAAGVLEMNAGNVTWVLLRLGVMDRFKDRLNGQRRAEKSTGRPRGRPRKDGLVTGSPEARAADLVKERERLAARNEIRGDREKMRRLREERLRVLAK